MFDYDFGDGYTNKELKDFIGVYDVHELGEEDPDVFLFQGIHKVNW